MVADPSVFVPSAGPRRSIRRKLAITFVLLALLPLGVVTALAASAAVRELRRQAQEALDFDLEIARLRAARSLRDASQHLDFLVQAILRDDLLAGVSHDDSRRIAQTFLSSDSSAIVRLKAIDAEGTLVFQVGLGAGPEGQEPGESGEFSYLIQAESAPPGSQVFLPVELRDPDAPPEALSVIPAIAILEPIFDDDGQTLGVAVAEASLPALFDALDVASPGMDGVTGLVDRDGHFLYHSERKNDWSVLLASQGTINLRTDFSPEVAEAILSGSAGTLRTDEGFLLSYRPLAESMLLAPDLTLYRAVPLSAVDASVRRFLVVTVLMGIGILGIVLWMAAVASRRVTQPIYAIREATRRLRTGAADRPLEVTTQDELQDLAEDFSVMAAALREHQRNLENMVAARTQELEATRSELAQVVRHAADAIIGLDRDGRVRLWNEGAEDLFGYGELEARGRSIAELIGTGDPAELHEAQTIEGRMERGEAISLRTRRRPRAGEPFPVSLTQAPVTDDEGRRVGSSLVIRDDRAQSRLEDQMRRSERLAAVSIMAAGLAHEINNPLAVIANRIELMQRTFADGEAVTEDLSVLREQVDRLRTLTGELLEFAREEDSPGPVHLDRAVERVTALLEQTFVTKGLCLSVETNGVAEPVPGNEKAIETVVMNLLLNAAQATPAGGTVRVLVSGDAPGPFVRLMVEDTGPGIPEGLRGRVFEPFFTGGAGTGLGLTVCRTIMERHAGKLWIDDSYSGGTRFVAEFPTRR